jgi:hypothetical protein
MLAVAFLETISNVMPLEINSQYSLTGSIKASGSFTQLYLPLRFHLK